MKLRAKTDAGRRWVPLAPLVPDTIAPRHAHRAAQDEQRKACDDVARQWYAHALKGPASEGMRAEAWSCGAGRGHLCRRTASYGSSGSCA